MPMPAPPSSSENPLIVTITAIAAVRAAARRSMNFVVTDSAFSLFGRQSSYPGLTSPTAIAADHRISSSDACGDRVARLQALESESPARAWRNLEYAPGLGPGGLRPVGVRVPPPALPSPRIVRALGAVAKLAKAPVSKTGDSRFESWLPRSIEHCLARRQPVQGEVADQVEVAAVGDHRRVAGRVEREGLAVGADVDADRLPVWKLEV